MKLINGDIITIVRGVACDKIASIGEVLLKADIKYIEVSLSEEKEGIACIKELNKQFGKDIRLGAGTVIRPDLVDKAANAGATYIITPAWDRELVRYIKSKNLSVFPGVFTPADIMQAVNEGLTQLKLFPVGNLPPSYIKNIKGPFPDVEFIGVGGVSKDNIREYYNAGCFSFAIGSDIIPRGSFEFESSLIQIEKSAREYISIIRELRE